MERTVEVATGESVAFRYELAGLGSRCFALAIDNAIQVTLALPIVLLFLWATSSFGRNTAHLHPAWLAKLARTIDASLVGILIFLAFAWFFGYFVIFEWLWEGRTPGKRALGLRVVRDGGFPLDFMAAVIRNLIRIVEVALGYYAVSAICALLSPQNRRLGDIVAGTIVVRGAHDEAGGRPHRPERVHGALAADLSDGERELVQLYAARRNSLTARARDRLAAQIAATVRPKLAASVDYLNDDYLLMFLAENVLEG